MEKFINNGIGIYIYNKEDGIPKEDTCYIIGKKGAYLKKTLDLISSLTPVDKISVLDDVPTYAEIRIPKIPVRMIANILGFFKAVYQKFKSESVVLLYYNKKKKSYKVFVPKQTVSYSGIDYKTDSTVPDHLLVGSIHSHADFSAFHSGVDKGDEAKFDGLHLTIGKVNSEFFEICGSIAINGMRVPIEPEDYVIGLESREYTTYFPHMFRPNFEVVDGEKIYDKDVKTSLGYVLNASEKDYEFNQAWMDNVEEKVYEPPTGMFNGFGGHYIWKDGKLERINDNLQTSFGFGLNHINEINVDQDMNLFDEKDDKCICSKCIHRCKKLELQDFEGIDERDLDDEFSYHGRWWE